MMSIFDEAARGGDISNWRKAPFSQWAFQHVDEIMPTAVIARGSGPAMALPESPTPLNGFRLAAADGKVLDLDAFLLATETDGFLVLHEGKIVHEAYGRRMTPQARHILMSSTKSITGLIAGILSQLGKIDLNAPICLLVPEVKGTAYENVTAQELLDMRSGVALNDEAQRNYDAATNWEPEDAARPTIHLHEFFSELKAPQPVSGGPFRYFSANTDLLGWVLERAGAKSFADLVSELLWMPMGAEANANITLDKQSAARCTGGVSTTLRDFARLGQLMLQGGRHAGRDIIPATLIRDIENNGDEEAWRTGDFAPAFPYRSMHYRNGWYVINDAPQTLFAMGVYGQNLFVDRTNGIVVAKFSSQAEFFDIHAATLTHRAVAEIRHCLID